MSEDYLAEVEKQWLEEWRKQKAIQEEVEPYIKEAKLRGDTYVKIALHIQKKYPEITESLVSKWGRKMLGSMQDYAKNEDGSLYQNVFYLRVDKKTYDAFQEARERLKADLGMDYAPTDRATIMDLINKC
jgi:hypothetical protein